MKKDGVRQYGHFFVLPDSTSSGDFPPGSLHPRMHYKKSGERHTEPPSWVNALEDSKHGLHPAMKR